MGPQGAAPSIGQISPLAAQLNNERGYANTYGPFLPRPPQTFTSGAFGPFSPIMPVPVDEPAPGASMPDARLYEYMVGWNLPVGQPGTEGIKLADFGTLKTLADLYSVARACIELRKNEIVGLDWDIVPTTEAAKAYNNSPRLMRDFGERRGVVRKFFAKPDPDYLTFTDFLSAALEDVFVFDAFSLLLRPKRGYRSGLGRGLMGSELDCIELISGPTIRPLVGLHGEKPRPPAPAYQQFLYGVARSDYMQLINERDLEENGMLNAEINQWSADQFIYRPLVPRRWTPYGFPPVERALIPVMSGLQKQAYQLDFFKEGTIPAVYISPGDVNMTPNQIRELQTALNAFAGDPAWHHKVIVLPPGSRVDPQKPVDVADQFDDIVMTQVCQAFDVNPMELGILPKVSAAATPSAVKQFAQAGAQLHERLSTKPLLKWLCDIFDSILHDVLHQYDMRFTFEGLQEDAEQGQLTNLLVEQIQNGLRSVDEAREQLELQPWGLPMTSEPVYFSAAGPLPFTAPALPATPGQQQGGQQDTRNREVSRQAPTANRAPLQQAGRAGGVASPTPGHAAARGALQGSRGGTGAVTGPSARGSVSSSKSHAPPNAVRSELEALVRHLNKGRKIHTWVPRYLDATTMEILTEDLSKGLSAEEAAGVAKTVLLGKGDYEWLPKASSREIPWTEITSVYSPELTRAFDQGIDEFAALLSQWWSGQLPVTRQALLDAFSEILYRRLWPVLRRLWAEAWRAYDETAGGYFESWTASHGRDILEKIVNSRMGKVGQLIGSALQAGEDAEWVIRQLRDVLDVDNRVQMIAVTEAGNAANDAAMRSFTDQQVAYKIWVTRHDGLVCAKCRQAEAEGPVSLQSLFSNGFNGPPAHPNCRCVLLPAEVDLGVMGEGVSKDGKITKEQAGYRRSDDDEFCGNCSMIRMNPPDFESYSCTLVKGLIEPEMTCDHWEPEKADKGDSSELHGRETDITCSRGHTHHGEYGAAGLLIRHLGEDGKTRYLLQLRSPDEDSGQGTWGLPGGAALEGESAQDAAFREAQEEVGDLPAIDVHHHVVDDHGNWQFVTFVCDADERFAPGGNGATQDETSGYGWFTAQEIGKLPLHPGFADAWDQVRNTRQDTTISKKKGKRARRVDLSGQEFITAAPDTNVNAPGGGGALPMSHDEDGIWHASPDDYHAGTIASAPAGGTAEDTDDLAGVKPHGTTVPAGDDGLGTGHGGTQVPPSKGPIPQGYLGGHWPQGGHGTTQPPASSTGSLHGTGPTIRSDKLLPRVSKEDAAAAVRAQLEENFPDQALQWLNEATWSGPADVPLKAVDFHDMKTWSAYREPDRVAHFERIIQQGEDFNPVVLIKVPGHRKYRVVDGHHRAMAFRRLGLPVRAWVGVVAFGWVHTAEETHSSQESQGASEGNQ